MSLLFPFLPSAYDMMIEFMKIVFNNRINNVSRLTKLEGREDLRAGAQPRAWLRASSQQWYPVAMIPFIPNN
jgi:hypothetical protein